MSCSRGSLENPKTGRCKAYNGFSLSELKTMARGKGVSTSGSKADIYERLLRKFGYRSKSRSSTRSKSRSRSRSRSKSTSRKTKRTSKRRSSTKRRSKSKSRRPASKSRSPSRSRSYVSRRRRATRRVRSTGRWVPSIGSGSFQSRHFKSGRKGPSLPAQSYRGAIRQGNDGNMWESRPDKNGVFHWKRV